MGVAGIVPNEFETKVIGLICISACTSYSRYILDVGQSEDWLALQVALSPCLIGYGVIAKRLHSDEKSVRTNNKYWKWIENYIAEDYSEAVRTGSGLSPSNPRQ